MKIFLIGFMGSGKTTIGSCLAEEFGYEFVDTDRIIEIQQGITIPEIFDNQGEAAFREMERNILIDIQNSNTNMVIATGGGMPCYNDNMDVMLACGKVVYLKTAPQALAQRLILSRNKRPLIKGKTEAELEQYIAELLSKREQIYERANITLQTESLQINLMPVCS